MHARYRQEIAAIGAIASETLVNNGSIEVVNIRSTKMMKEFFAAREFIRPRNYGFHLAGLGGARARDSYPSVIASEAKQSIAQQKEKLDCFVAALLAMTLVSRAPT